MGGGQQDNLPDVERLRQENARLRALLQQALADLDAVHRSTSWRVTAPLRRAVAAWRGGTGRRAEPARFAAPLDAAHYREWVILDEARRRRGLPDLAERLRAAPPPRVALLVAVDDDAPAAMARSLAALRRQAHAGWELHAVDLATTRPQAAGALASLAADPRVTVHRAASRDRAAALRLAMQRSEAPLLGVLEPGDVLAEDALARLALAFAEAPDLALALADEDVMDEAGVRQAPRFRPGWSPDLLLADPEAAGRAWLLRRELAEAAGGFRDAMGAAAARDLLLRAALDLPPGRVRHLPLVLLHGLPPPESLPDAGAHHRAALDAARREDSAAQPIPGPGGQWFAWSRRPALVSVIIPTRDRAELLADAVRAVLAEPDPPVEVLVVDNDSREPRTRAVLAELARDPRLRVLPVPGAFNWSALNMAAVAEARGEVLVLLNNDIAAIEPGWLAPLAAEAMRPGVGAVGALLLYPDGSVQHAGVHFDRLGRPHHLLRGVAEGDPAHRSLLAHPRNVSAVTGACLAIRRDLLLELGGLDEAFPSSNNDVDLCLRAVRAGHRVLWSPLVRLRHLEGATRGIAGEAPTGAGAGEDFALLHERWGRALTQDRYLNPNLDIRVGGALLLVHPDGPG